MLARLWKSLRRIRVDSRLVLLAIVLMPCILFLMVIDNWQEMRAGLSRESAIAVMRSRVDAVKFTQALETARASPESNLDPVELRFEILMSRRSILENVPEQAESAAESSTHQELENLLDLLDALDTALYEGDAPPQERLDELSRLSANLDTYFQSLEAKALEDSNTRIASNVARSEALLWISAVLFVGMMAAAVLMWLHKARDARLLRLQNTELETARRLSEYSALHDDLTGLPNRRFLDRALKELAVNPMRDGRVALLHVDLDRFKEINDTLGHAAGDHVLARVGQRISETLNGEEFVARIGGDEFLVMVPFSGSRERLTRKVEALMDAIAKPINYHGNVCEVGASIGVADQPAASLQPANLMINADVALYRAKQDGRNRFAFFSDAMQAEMVLAKALSEDIARGLDAGEFIPVYQPQFAARTRRIVGVEALARWEHPEQGLLAPGVFLRAAENMGALAQIDDEILTSALDDSQTALTNGTPMPRISVNVSANRLNDQDLIERLRTLAIRPGSLSFELVETVFLDETEEIVTDNIRRIREMGIDIEIDDFGTGHASISGVLKIAPNRLKIDRQFVAGIERSESQRALLASVIAIGKSQRIEIVAEGVETEEQIAILDELGCDVLQGYALARPMRARALMEFLDTYSAENAYAAS